MVNRSRATEARSRGAISPSLRLIRRWSAGQPYEVPSADIGRRSSAAYPALLSLARGCSGKTWSVRNAAVSFMRRPKHDGHQPRPLQLKPTSRARRGGSIVRIIIAAPREAEDEGEAVG